MGLKDQIVADVKSAMKNKEQDKLSTLRMLHSEIKNKEIAVRPNELSEDDTLAVLKKLAKQRKDSIEQFGKANRQDLVDKETAELAVLEAYLPEQMGKEQIEAIVAEVITAESATSMKDMSRVMKAVMAKTKGAADNKLVSELVRTKLQ